MRYALWFPEEKRTTRAMTLKEARTLKKHFPTGIIVSITTLEVYGS